MRFPFFRPGGIFRSDPYRDYPEPRLESSTFARSCSSRIFGCGTTIIIILAILLLFYLNPPWFQQIRQNIVDFFNSS